jgi:AraC-like DNA-binding protein
MIAGLNGADATLGHTVAASAVTALMELAVAKGASRGALSARSGIDASALQDPNGRVPFARYVALMRAGQALCDDPALALHFGESVDASEFSLGCTIGGFSDSGVEAFALMNRYARLTVEIDDGRSGDRYVVARERGRLWLLDRRPNPNDFPELTESSFARMVCGVRRAFGENRFVRAVHVTHTAPAYRAEYDRIFRMPVVFGSDRNAFLLTDDGWLHQRPPSPSRAILGILRAHAEAQLDALDRSKSTRGRVASALAHVLGTQDARIGPIARALGVSRQTLFRRLKAEGTTFELVLDDLRRQLALRSVSARQGWVSETAYRLGYADPAAFSRAFKRWTGASPRAYAERSGTGERDA